MSENEQSLNQVLNELLKIFPSPELEALVRQLADPLKCKNSKEMIKNAEAKRDVKYQNKVEKAIEKKDEDEMRNLLSE